MPSGRERAQERDHPKGAGAGAGARTSGQLGLTEAVAGLGLPGRNRGRRRSGFGSLSPRSTSGRRAAGFRNRGGRRRSLPWHRYRTLVLLLAARLLRILPQGLETGRQTRRGRHTPGMRRSKRARVSRHVSVITCVWVCCVCKAGKARGGAGREGGEEVAHGEVAHGWRDSGVAGAGSQEGGLVPEAVATGRSDHTPR